LIAFLGNEPFRRFGVGWISCHDVCFGCFHERDELYVGKRIRLYLDWVLYTFSDRFSISNIHVGDFTLSRIRLGFDVSVNGRLDS
jgi:hypothetical protein